MTSSSFIGFSPLNKIDTYNALYKFLATADKVRTKLELLNDFYVSNGTLFNAVSPCRPPFLVYALNVYAKSIESNIIIDKCIYFDILTTTHQSNQIVNDSAYIVTVKNDYDITYQPKILSLYTDYNKRSTVIIISVNNFDKSTTEKDSSRMLYDIYIGLLEAFFPSIERCEYINRLLFPEIYLSSDNSNLTCAYIAILDLINSTINYWYGKTRNIYNDILISTINCYPDQIDKIKERLMSILCDESNEKIAINKDRINTYLARLGKALNKEYKVTFGVNELMM